MKKIARVTVKSLAALFAVSASFLMLCVWMLSSKPLDSTNFTPYVEAAMIYLVPETRAHIKKTALSWDNQGQTLNLSCEGVEIVDSHEAKVLSFPRLQLKMNVWSFLRGRMLPLEMTADAARVWLVRNKAGSLSLGGYVDEGEVSEGVYVKPLLTDIAAELANPKLHQKIDIKNVQLFIRDMNSAQKASINVSEISLNHDAKESVGYAKIELADHERPIYVEAKYHFDFETGEHHTSLDFQDIYPASLAKEELKLQSFALLDLPLSGHLAVATDKALRVSDAVIDIEGGAGELVQPELWDKALSIKNLVVKGGFDKDKNAWVLRDVKVDFGGPVLDLKAEAKAPLPKGDLWRHKRQDYGYWAKVTLTDLPLAQFGVFWPKSAMPNAREWIIAHMKNGGFSEGSLTLKGRVDWDDLAASTLDTGEGKLAAAGVDVLYMDGMPPIQEAAAEATYDLTKMDVHILKGHAGDVNLKPFVIQMTGLADEVQYITIPAALTGPLRTVIRHLSGPPLGYADELGLKSEDMGGSIDGVVTLHMPMLSDLYLKDVEVKAKASLHNFSSFQLIEDFPLEEGELAFALDGNGFTLKGPLRVRRLPFNLSWQTSFNKSEDIKEPLHQAELVGSVTGADWARSELLPTAHYQGVMPLTVRYAQTDDGYTSIDCEAGLTQADLTVDKLNWHKEAGKEASLFLDMEVTESKNIAFSSIKLKGKDVNVQGRGELDTGTGELVALSLDPFIVGRSHGKLRITKPEKDGDEIAISIKGEAFDISGLSDSNEREAAEEGSKEEGSKKKREWPVNYEIKTGTLYTSENGFLKDVDVWARRDSKGWDEMRVDAVAMGKMPLRVALHKEKKIRKLFANGESLGTALEGLGMTDTVEGGEFSLWGESTSQAPYTIKGEMKVKSFKVSDAPILARLFSAISPFGFMDLITGDSSFDRMKTKFTWGKDVLIIDELQAPGSVAGINVKGKIDLKTDKVNLRGTVVPFSFVNSILGSIPLLGDVITGGKGQGVIAASFKMTGPLSDTEISVNPVSLLTPGFLRNLFFSGDTEDKAEGDKQ
ncbi:MAG: AsmA-like C-terminal domain-containing protein [Bdellovibrionales bacterium]